MGLAMEIYESLTYAMFALDLLDAGLDYGFVVQLAKNTDTVRHAAWLGVCTTIALIMEVVSKQKKILRALFHFTFFARELFCSAPTLGRPSDFCVMPPPVHRDLRRMPLQLTLDVPNRVFSQPFKR